MHPPPDTEERMTLQDGITWGMLLAALASALLSVYCANRSFHEASYGKFSKAILWIAGGFAPLAYAALYTGVLAFAREISLT